ncbi:hypothetical protein ACFL2E_11860, partial [Thermodesulfobacteriota bacterium]
LSKEKEKIFLCDSVISVRVMLFLGAIIMPPFLGVVVDSGFFGETMSLPKILGACLILSAVVILGKSEYKTAQVRAKSD